MQAQITTSTQTDMRPWDYLFVDQPSGCITLGNSVTLTISLYVRGNLCLENNSQASGARRRHHRKPLHEQPAGIGRNIGQPDRRVQRVGRLLLHGDPAPLRPVHATSTPDAVGTNPPIIAKPTADLPTGTRTPQLGPQSACTTGSFPGGFDNDTTLNVSRGEIDLTPASAYDCRKLDALGEHRRADQVAAGLARAR